MTGDMNQNKTRGSFAAVHVRRLAATLSALALCGCTSVGVALGLRTRLADEPVTAVAATLSPGPALPPGGSGRLIITATTTDGRQLVTVGAGRGKVLFDSFSFDSQIVGVRNQDVVTMPGDPRLSDGKIGHVHVAVVGHPGVTAELDVPPRYNAYFEADFSGAPGLDGTPGFDGMQGNSGSDGSIDAEHPRRGGDGGRGSDGTNGGDGGPGGRGKDVHVWIRLRPDPRPLLQARVASGDREQLFLVDPQDGSLEVRADGGRGGHGGRAGQGGQGGMGGSGSPSGSTGQSGMDGRPGRDGEDGPAGTITVSVDPAAQPFMDRLQLSNSSHGEPGLSPQIQVETVPPLW